jgi:tellurite methyltransferase
LKTINTWEKSYQNTKQLWSSNPDSELMQYFDLVLKGKVLDLGIGEGRNAMPFIFSGFSIDGVDISDTALNRCKEKFAMENSDINLVSCDLRDYDIKMDNYTLIIVANVLNFFRKSEIDNMIQDIKAGLQKGGLIYLSVFSTLEPKYKTLKLNQKEVEENTFYIEEKDMYTHFFTQEEIKSYFSDFELICLCEGLEYDEGQGNPHYHGGIEFLARKKNENN